MRTNHVHLVVEADARPERIMNDLKSYASRYLNGIGLDEVHRKRWARHGSTRWLWKPQSLENDRFLWSRLSPGTRTQRNVTSRKCGVELNVSSEIRPRVKTNSVSEQFLIRQFTSIAICSGA